MSADGLHFIALIKSRGYKGSIALEPHYAYSELFYCDLSHYYNMSKVATSFHDVSCIDISADGCRAITAHDNGMLRIWALPGGECEYQFESRSLDTCAVKMSADGCSAISAGRDGSVKVWDFENTVKLRYELHIHQIQEIALNRDLRRAISVGLDGRFCVWNFDNDANLNSQ